MIVSNHEDSRLWSLVMINTEPSEGMLTPDPKIEISLRNVHKFTCRDLNMAAPHTSSCTNSEKHVTFGR